MDGNWIAEDVGALVAVEGEREAAVEEGAVVEEGVVVLSGTEREGAEAKVVPTAGTVEVELGAVVVAGVPNLNIGAAAVEGTAVVLVAVLVGAVEPPKLNPVAAGAVAGAVVVVVGIAVVVVVAGVVDGVVPKENPDPVGAAVGAEGLFKLPKRPPVEVGALGAAGD